MTSNSIIYNLVLNESQKSATGPQIIREFRDESGEEHSFMHETKRDDN